MSTLRQRNLAKAIVKNSQAKNPKNKKELLVSAGYDETTAKATPGRELEAKGVKDELIVLGFDPYTAKGVVSNILKSGQNDNVKLKAADMVFKVHGSYAAEKQITLTMTAPSEKIIDLANRLLVLQSTHEKGIKNESRAENLK